MQERNLLILIFWSLFLFIKTPLHFAAQEGYSKAIKTLLKQKNIIVNARDDQMATPLHYAAQNGRSHAISILLARPEIEVNARDEKGVYLSLIGHHFIMLLNIINHKL